VNFGYYVIKTIKRGKKENNNNIPLFLRYLKLLKYYSLNKIFYEISDMSNYS